MSQDTVAPTFASATVSGTTLVIAFNEPLGAAGSLANSAFTVKKGPSGSQTTLTLSSTAPVISGSTVTLTLSTASSVTASDTNVLVTYTKPTTGTANKLLDAFGNETGTFEDQAVTNLLSDTAATAPTAADGTVTTNEDTVHTFAAASFSYSDTDGDALASVKITGLPAAGKGTLALDGTVIASTALPVTVTAAELTENKLKYAPPANANGTGYASFRFRVNDGASDSDLDYTMTINVTAVNDPATGTPTINGTALVGQTLTASIADIADADGLPGTFTYQWKRYAANGTTFEANIGANSSTYTLTASEEGKKVKIEVSFTDNGSTNEGPLSSGAYPASGTVAAVSTDATLSALTVSPKDISGFAADRTSYEVGVASTVTQATITATKGHSAATVAYSTTDAETSAGHQVNLSAGRNEVTITVTAEDTTTTGTYTVSINRGVTAVFGWKASDDFDGLITAENNRPVGMWSDGTTMWVSDLRGAKIHAYNLDTKALDASKDFDTLDAASNGNPGGIWSDGTTMWVADYADSKVYAYNLTTKARDASRDFDTPDRPTGIWSDGTTMWVAAHQPGNIYAYDMSTKARDAGKDFDTVSAAGNSHPGGIWSNNITMWATDEDDGKLYAYNMASKARDAGKDFNTLIAAGNGSPGGIWANTNTMWASDAGDDKIYSYNMPVIAPNTAAAGTPAVTAPNVFRVPAVLGVDLSGITDADGTTGIASNATYKWQRFAANGTTLETDSIGTASTYTLTDADAGKTLKVVVSYTDDGGNSEGPLTSAATRAITAAASCAAPTLTGGAVFLGPARKVGVGEFALGGHAYHGFNKAADAGSIDNPSFTTAAPNDYEILGAATKDSRDWMVALNGAFPANVHRTLAVHFCDEDIAFNAATPRPRDGIYYYTSATPPQHWAPHAERTIYVSQDTAAPTFASATVSGTTLVITLSEDLGTAASLANGAFTVKKGSSGTAQTLSGTPSISGSTVTLTLATAVTTTDTAVKVAYTKPMSGSANKLIDEFGNETATFPDQDVTNNTATNTPATGVPTISGTAAVGQTLTASTTGISDTDGLPSAFAYQWKRVDSNGMSNPTNIGTNSATYTLTDSEVGKKVLVEVSFTDNATNSEGPLVSAAYPSTGTVRAADNTAPTVTSIERHDPTEPLTNSDTPTWRVTFSEAVKNVDATDFTIAGTTAAPTVTAVTLVTGGYDVTPTGGDIASLTGTITLAFASGQNIADTADNELAATAPTGINEPTFEMDNTVPTFVSGTANGTLIVMTFSEELDPNSLPPASAFNISTDSNVMANSVSIEGAMVTLTVTPAIIVNQTVDVNNNAYAGTGTVPLKDTAGNEVQPAAIVGSYRVTNETPIGPPASLRAEAGDGRVRLVWTRPAGISQFIDYQFRHAPGTSVPVGTAWIGITSDEGLTELVQELANGMTHAFEVRAIRDSDVGAAATVSATPMADTCMLDLDDRREVWSATMTVGRDIKTELAQTDAGYRRGIFGSLPQDGDSFMIGGASYTIKDIFTIVRNDGVRRQLFLELVNSRRFTPAVKEALRFHWCSNSSGLADPTPRGYLASNPYQADWSLYTTREIALSLPANNSATGTPMITGTAVAAQALTASTTGISDPDGLPSAFAYQWKRVDSDGISNPTNIGADSATYTLTDNEVGKKVLVEVSFTDSLTGAESLASAAHPSTGTVRAADTTAPTVKSITPQDPTSSPTNSDSLTWRVTFSEAVSNVDSADFVITGTTATLTVTAVTSMTGVYDVTASGGDLATVNGAVTLAFAANQNIADTADNDLAATAPTGTDEPTFEMDNTIPTLVSGTANGVLIVLTFSEDLDPNSIPQASSFSISALSSLSVLEPVANSVSIEGAIVTLTVTPAFITDHAVQVYNNAYDDGMGRVPLKDFAGNAVQQAATVGSYSVTNETPIGPPASLTAEAGDGRVRLVWTGPAGTSQLVGYQYRYAAGTSVPEETGWTGTNSAENLTLLLSGLANGTPHTFELQGVRDSEVGATATVSATPLAAVCSTPDPGDRREVWSATLTVGRYTGSPIGRTLAGYSMGSYGNLGHNGDRIMIGGASYTIDYLYTTLGGEGIRNNIFMALDNSKTFTSAVRGSLRFHWCSDSSGFDNSNDSRYRVSHHHEADWSLYDTRELALSLPANNSATGTPMITGTAVAAQALTASTTGISDPDGLPSAFAYQWKRVDSDGISNPTNIGADSATYTLTDNEVGKKVLVEVSFTDSLTGAESLASAAHPSTGTVRAADTTAPTVKSITPQDPTSSPTNSDSLTWRVTFSEAVSNVDSADFVITGTTATLTVTAVTSMTGVYDVTASGGDLATVNGAVTLAFAANQNIVDPSDNTLTATTPTDANDPTFELDNTVPTFVSGTANGTLIVLTFSEDLDPNSLPPGEAFDVSALGNFSAPQPVVNSVAIEGTMVTLTVTPALFTDHTVTVSNNAYDDGMGRVPLKDFAGNAIQPAATVGSYSVTNETPIGPPASLRAEAGDGRVRLVWTAPVGIDLQTAYHQYRYAPGTSVPEETDWTETTNLGNLTTLVQGLANGTPHAFEVRAIRGSEVGATATVSATPMTGVCSTPDLGDRREVWSATLTVGRSISSQGQTSAGYRRGELGSLSQDGDRIIIGSASYTIEYISTVVRTDGDRRRLFLELVDFRRFTPAVKEALRFHWCSDSSGFNNPSAAGYGASNPYEADWSIHTTRELALSLPANNDATGTPDITGRALAGQTLTAGTGNTADADGLPQNASDFAWQWIRAADETDTPIQDATSITYTLTDDDAGKQVKVVMSFTDSLSGVESLISDAYPGTGTVSAAPMPLAVTQREDRPYTFTESDFSNLPGGVVQLTEVIITELPNNGWLARSKIVLLPSGNYQGQSDRIYSRHLPLTLSTDHRRLSLAFFPEDDAHGTPYTTFKFKVNAETTVHTMTINVTPVNDPAYGKVFINGPSQVGYDLTASTSSMGDRDGIPQNQLNYQWKRYSSDGNTFEADIGANSNSYRVTDNDVGKKVKVEVSYVDGGGTSEATLSEAFPYITDQTIGESTFQSIMGSAGDTFYDFTAEHGQAFTTGTHPNGYTLSRVVLQSEDAEGDDLAVKICGVNTNGNPNTICTDLNVPGSFTRGLLSFTAPSNTTLDGGRTNYMVVISSTGGDSVRLDATRSGGFDPSALGSGWSIATKTRMNTTAGWQDVNGTRIRIAILGTINP